MLICELMIIITNMELINQAKRRRN
uniref:Uncharacterized protein n=1 Tax=Arundo donax TaxID=35708 RepID=A0A0A9FTF8_ARUDO